jgi:uncharacterized membrane protein/nitrite reductase/ring-hydroxylating ferredoxin subunit
MRSRAQIKSHPIHPILVTFPIGLWITSLVFDLIGRGTGDARYWTAGFFCIIGGCIMAACAAVAGVIDLFGSIPPSSSARRRGYIHGGLNSLALLVFIAVAWYRGDGATTPNGLAIGLSILGVILILISGWLGGTLVYRNQIGVDHRYAAAGKFKERNLAGFDQPVMNESELADGQMMLANIEDHRVVLGRCGDGVFAFADHCTHKGGPLSDGALVGCTVQCPWHGSQFDIRNGRVVSGPAEHKLDTYAVELRNREVYVKRPAETKKGKQDEKKAA